ncbi:hypothetical protein SESBI_38668 [Sesbania bispinosa]|nr:hypothetical protein SESBI_38668 [Sesbania bispinosa]
MMSEEAIERISERLSCLENLYFPRVLQSTATLPSQRKTIFRDILSRDVTLFLGKVTYPLITHLPLNHHNSKELSEFDSMKEDYEINWHITRLRSTMSPTSEELRKRS